MNPQALVNMMLQRNPTIKNNPMIQNAMQMAQQNNVNGLQDLANNIARSKGLDINQVANQVKGQFNR